MRFYSCCRGNAIPAHSLATKLIQEENQFLSRSWVLKLSPLVWYLFTSLIRKIKVRAQDNDYQAGSIATLQIVMGSTLYSTIIQASARANFNVTFAYAKAMAGVNISHNSKSSSYV